MLIVIRFNPELSLVDFTLSNSELNFSRFSRPKLI